MARKTIGVQEKEVISAMSCSTNIVKSTLFKGKKQGML